MIRLTLSTALALLALPASSQTIDEVGARLSAVFEHRSPVTVEGTSTAYTGLRITDFGQTCNVTYSQEFADGEPPTRLYISMVTDRIDPASIRVEPGEGNGFLVGDVNFRIPYFNTDQRFSPNHSDYAMVRDMAAEGAEGASCDETYCRIEAETFDFRFPILPNASPEAIAALPDDLRQLMQLCEQAS